MAFRVKEPAYKEPRIIFTKQGYEDQLKERKRLLEERPDAVINLTKSREMGDLSENGYYKAARQRLSAIDANLRRVERLIRCAKIVETFNTGTVEIGRTVTLSGNGKSVTYTIVGGYESDPMKKTISHMSPIGKAILGKRIGETVQIHIPAGVVSYTIEKIE